MNMSKAPTASVNLDQQLHQNIYPSKVHVKRLFSFSSLGFRLYIMWRKALQENLMGQRASRWRSQCPAAPQVSTLALRGCRRPGCICSLQRSPAASSALWEHCGGAGGQEAGGLCGSSNRPSHYHRPCRSPPTWVLVPDTSHTEPGSPVEQHVNRRRMTEIRHWDTMIV